MSDFNLQIKLAREAEINEQNYSRAIGIYEDLINEYPDRIQPYYYLGMLQENLGNIKGAIECLNKAVEICPFYEGYKSLGIFYVIEKDLTSAFRYLKLALLYNSYCEETQSIINQVFPNHPPICRPGTPKISGMYESSKYCSQITYHHMYDEKIIQRDMPKYVEEILTDSQKQSLEAEAMLYQTNHCKDSFVIKVPNGRAFIKQGIHPYVITPDNKFLQDMSFEDHPNFEDYSICKEERLPREITIADKMLLLSSAWGGNYYHWLTWTIPRLHMIEKAGYKLQEFDKIIIDYLGFGFQMRLLEVLGIPRNKIIGTMPNGALLRAKTLVTASFPDCRHTPKYVTDSLRERFLKPDYMSDDRWPKKIYVSRNKGGSRRILNEDILYLYLSNLGFKIVYCEDLSFEEQVALFANAEMIVAPHGAGLVNLTFCKPGTKIVEIFNEHHLDTGYFRICSNVELDHYILFGEPVDNEFKDITVDMDKLAKTFELAQISG